MTEERIRLDVSGDALALGGFEVHAITAGIGNRWQFDAGVLAESLALWDGAECFVDHAEHAGAPRSVRDLGGVLHSPRWDEQAQGITLSLKPVGPSAALVRELGRELLNEDPKPRVGFSADVGFTADGKRVTKILRVYSVDLVFNPARGGAFLRALNSVAADSREGGNMSEALQEDAAQPQAANGVQPNAELEAVRQLLDVQKEKTALLAEAEKAQAVRAQMCAYLLDSGLAASKLPQPAQERVRKQFAGRVFEPSELTAAIDDARKLVAELTGGQAVAGLKHVTHGMFNSDDQITAAVQDLFGVEREEHLKSVNPARLSGIRELYLGLTGDMDFYGGYDAQRVMFQATTATFPGLVKNAMNKLLVERWNLLGRKGYDWWENVATVEHFNDLKTITWLIFGTIASLPSVAQGAEYTELKIGDGAETSDFTKYGGYVGVTLEAIINDDTRKLRAIPRELANAGIRGISSLVAAIFTSNSAVGPTMADTGALFNSTAVTTAGGHANLLTTALGTDYTAWEAAAAAVYNQPMLVANETGDYGTGAKMALDPTICLVPRTLKGQAESLFLPRWGEPVSTVPTAGGHSYAGVVKPITVPEWTDTNNWAAVVDKELVPGIMIGEAFGIMPEIFIAGDQQSPAMFSNDESRIKVRHWVAVGVADFRPLHKSNVA